VSFLKFSINKVGYLLPSHSWNKDIPLSDLLISTIMEDKQIKQALFPSPGPNASSSKGGGKPKTEHHYAIAQIMFTDHLKYCDAFQKVEDAEGKEGIKLRRLLGNEIKNWLVKYVTLYNKL
jgi:hypothetical protein